MSNFLKSLGIAGVFSALALVSLYLSTGWPGPTEATYGDPGTEGASARQWAHFAIVFLVPALLTGTVEFCVVKFSSKPWSSLKRILVYLASLVGFIAIIIAAHKMF